MLAPLPIDPFLPAIAEAARPGNVVIVAEPGAGKTTRVPRALLDHGLAARGEIVVLEPRRIATRMAARRVAEELGEELGRRVGYTVRFDDVSSRETRVRFVTEGVLTRRLVSDPTLHGVAAIVLDELHERSLHADLALAIARSLQRRERPDLRLIAMSATIDAEPFAAFLDAPVIRVPGRRFEVAIEHAEGADDRPLERRIAAQVKRALREEPDGHVLVFLPGAAEIRRAAEAIGEIAGIDVLPLHGDLPPADQDRAVRAGPRDRRKVILATNVAETSLTIEGVVAVIDSGLARVARHSPWSGLPRLVTEPICRASATQRAGRAGRTRAGRAIRLYSRHEHDARPAHDAPEIQRVDLAETILSLRARGVRDPLSFPFFEAPARASVEAADALLGRLGAISADGAVTSLGRAILALPLHPRLARIVLACDEHGLGDRGALLAAILAERDLRLSARTRIGGGDRASVESGPSDALHRLELFESVEAGGPASAARLRAHGLDVGGGLSVARARAAIVRTLRRLDRARKADTDLDADAVLLRAIALGFPDRIARRRRPKEPEIVFAAGGSARLAETSVVREAELLIAIDAEERRHQVEVRTASAISGEDLLELFPDRIEDVREIRFDPARGRIERIAALRYGAITIDESRSDAAGEPGAAEVLARAAMQAGIDRFLDRDELVQLRSRIAAARKADPTIPELDDARLEAALARACEGRRSFEELAQVALLDLVIAELGDAIARLDRLAPSHASLPGRKRVAIHYEADRPPWIESRMQDFFGWKEGPKVGGEPIVLHLLAPNQRAVQVTTDLAGFWERHYPALRKELMRRYPRHAWPEDPTIPPPAR